MQIVLILALFLSGCSAAHISAMQQSDLAYAYCIQGNGPPLTGGGYIVAIGIKKEFQGIIAVQEGCQVMVDHYVPKKEQLEELERRGFFRSVPAYR